jgi:hypothetical protein
LDRNENQNNMTNDDRSTDQFIREVDEELRREQLTTLWQRFGNYVIGACVLVVLVTAGFKGWDWWKRHQAERVGDLYIAADRLVQDEKSEEAIAAFEAIAASERGGYAAMASLRAAALKIDAGDKAGAVTLFDNVASDSSVDDILRDLASLRAAYLVLDQGDLDGAAKRVDGLAVPGNPWRHGAREILGLVAMEKGEKDVALSRFSEIEGDPQAPADTRARATALIAVLQGGAAPETGANGGENTTPTQ